MANVTETSTWEAGIYQLETTDPVEGGALGISNTQAKQLANRTKWLYDQIISLFKLAPKNRGYISGLDINNPSGTITVGGDVSSATVTVGTSESFITVNLSNSMGNTNYKVRFDIQSLGTLASDNDIETPVFKVISATQFQIAIRESGTITQNLKLHIEAISLD